MNYIKLYHEIWNYNLSVSAFRSYCALLRFMNTDTWYANVAVHKLAAAVGLSEKSIYRGISELQSKKLLSVLKDIITVTGSLTVTALLRKVADTQSCRFRFFSRL